MQQLEKSRQNLFVSSSKKYDQYVNEFNVLYEKLLSVDDNAISSEPAKPVALKFCVDAELIGSGIGLGRIMDTETGQAVADYETHWDKTLRAYRDYEAESSRDVVAIQTIRKIVSKSLRMDMRNQSASSRVQPLFISYYSLASSGYYKT